MRLKPTNLLWLCVVICGGVRGFNIDSDGDRRQFSINPSATGDDSTSFFGFSIGLFKTLSNAR